MVLMDAVMVWSTMGGAAVFGLKSGCCIFILIFAAYKTISLMPDNKDFKCSLSGIVDKMNATYDGLIGEGFSPGINRRVVPVMIDRALSGWKIAF